jgi:hypothetical protein
MTKKQSSQKPHKTDDKKDSVERLVDYFSWRHPYCGDEEKAREAAAWALSQASKSPEVIAVLLLEAVNERNSLRKSLHAIGIIATNHSFVESATRESVEWAFGGKLKPSAQKKDS